MYWFRKFPKAIGSGRMTSPYSPEAWFGIWFGIFVAAIASLITLVLGAVWVSVASAVLAFAGLVRVRWTKRRVEAQANPLPARIRPDALAIALWAQRKPPLFRNGVAAGLRQLRDDEFREARRTFVELLSQEAVYALNATERSNLLVLIARCDQELDQFTEAEKLYLRALALVQQAETSIDTPRALRSRLSQLIHWRCRQREKLRRRLRARILIHLGSTERELSKYEEALAHLEEALGEATALEDPGSQAAALGNLGLTYRSRGEFPEALQMFESAVALNEKHALDGLANALANKALVLSRLTDPPENPRDVFHRALEVSQERGHLKHEARTTAQLGKLELEAGDNDAAEVHLQRALELSIQASAPQSEIETRANLGKLYRETGRFELAIEYFERAIEREEQMGYRVGLAKTLRSLAWTYFERARAEGTSHDLLEARSLFEKSINAWRTLGAQGTLERARTLEAMAKLEQEAAKTDRRRLSIAASHLEAAAALQRDYSTPKYVKTLRKLASTREDIAFDYPPGEAQALMFQAAAECFQEVGDTADEATNLYRASRSWKAVGTVEALRHAAGSLARVVALNAELGHQAWEAKAAYELGEVREKLAGRGSGITTEAGKAFSRALDVARVCGDTSLERRAGAKLRAIRRAPSAPLAP